MNSLMDSELENYCFALNLGVSEHLFFVVVSFLYWKSIILKLTVLVKVLRVDLSFNCNRRIWQYGLIDIFFENWLLVIFF